MDYDSWISTNPKEIELDKKEKYFDAWIDNETDFEAVAGYLGWDDYDILNYIKNFQNDYYGALTQLKFDYWEDLTDYFLNHVI